jgi:hypothetical protein
MRYLLNPSAATSFHHRDLGNAALAIAMAPRALSPTLPLASSSAWSYSAFAI